MPNINIYEAMPLFDNIQFYESFCIGYHLSDMSIPEKELRRNQLSSLQNSNQGFLLHITSLTKVSIFSGDCA